MMVKGHSGFVGLGSRLPVTTNTVNEKWFSRWTHGWKYQRGARIIYCWKINIVFHDESNG